MEILTQEQSTVNFVEAPANGVHYNEYTNEYEVWIDGEIWYYNRQHGNAHRVYGQALAQMRQHAERCPRDRYGLEAVA